MGMELFPPTRSISRSCNTRNSAIWISPGRSPISSKKIVPPFADSRRPRRLWVAPVKEPFSCPKSSEAIREGGIAAQLTPMIYPLRSFVDRPRNQLFSCTGFTKDKNRGVGRCHLGNSLEHRSKRVGRADDIFKHRVAIDLLSQRQIFIPRSFFRSNAIIDVGSRCVPAGQLPLLISEGIVANQEPSVRAVFSACS